MNYKGFLLERFAKKRSPPPEFSIEGADSDFSCVISWTVESGDTILVKGASARTKKEAQRSATFLALGEFDKAHAATAVQEERSVRPRYEQKEMRTIEEGHIVAPGI